MRRRASPRSQQGALLVEAVISAVVIATGLVLISRNVGTQLRAAASIAASETLLDIGHDVLIEMEARQLATLARSGEPVELDPNGSVELGRVTYDWALSAREAPDAGQDLAVRQVTVRARPQDGGPVVALSAIWPASWVPDNWIQ